MDFVRAKEQPDLNSSIDPKDIAATGGTNWQKYLPPRFQKRIFYPELWSDTEKEEWGKAWVEENVFFNHTKK